MWVFQTPQESPVCTAAPDLRGTKKNKNKKNVFSDSSVSHMKPHTCVILNLRIID